MIVLFVLLAAFLLIVSIINFAQMVSFGLQYADHYTTASEFWRIDSFWAWVIGSLILMVALWIVRKVFTICNGLIVVALSGIVSLFSSNRNRVDNFIRAAVVVSIILWIFWTVVSFFATKAIFDAAAAYSDITDYFIHGNWIAYIMVFFTVRGVFFESKNNN